jgi:hypothetical protein
MKLPNCPNVREGVCERSMLRLLGEDEQSWVFTCASCHLIWKVSKPRTAERARYELEIDRTQRASEAERAAAKQTRYFMMPSKELINK